MNCPPIPYLNNNPALENQYYLKQNIVYSKQTGEDLKLTMILPWHQKEENIANKPMPGSWLLLWDIETARRGIHSLHICRM